MKNPLLYLDKIENIILKSDLQSVFEILKKAIVVEGSDNWCSLLTHYFKQ